jgi:predicted tellurium resistance membrane protein TerC
VVGQLIALVQRYPALVDGAFVIIAWVGIKLMLEYLFAEEFIRFEVPRWLSLTMIIVIFFVALFYAKAQGPAQVTPAPLAEKASELLKEEQHVRAEEGTRVRK